MSIPFVTQREPIVSTTDLETIDPNLQSLIIKDSCRRSIAVCSCCKDKGPDWKERFHPECSLSTDALIA